MNLLILMKGTVLSALRHSCYVLALALACGTLTVLVGGQESLLDNRTIVAKGWHNWYEVKADPENQNNVIICGTRLDAARNAFVGFVYASSDGGATWKSVLEDKNSTWVSEQSCAFGTQHRAYFLSEASKVIDGDAHHDLGTTRLYMSSDGGQHWAESLKTAWADFSTSAVNTTSSDLYTFFNSGPVAADHEQYLGTTIGLLIFSPDGRHLTGPIYSPTIQRHNYYGTYPSGAIALKSGGVVAFYIAFAGPPFSWQEFDLGIIRAGPGSESALKSTTVARITTGKDCPYTGKGSLAYNAKLNRLFLLYGDGCKNRPILLTSSDDEGRTWTKSVPIVKRNDQVIYSPSLVTDTMGGLHLLWRDGAHPSRWMFSGIHDFTMVDPPVELSHDPDELQISNDAIWTSMSNRNADDGTGWDHSINVHLALNNVMSVLRLSGVAPIRDKFLAVWPFGSKYGMGLYSAVLDPTGMRSPDPLAKSKKKGEIDVTDQTAMLYGGLQRFDAATSTLDLRLILKNLGAQPMMLPIEIEATDVRSGIGSVQILNATNGNKGAGARWDISPAVVGDRIPPRSASQPFDLSFHIDVPPARTSLDMPDLLNLKVRVYASPPCSSQACIHSE